MEETKHVLFNMENLKSPWLDNFHHIHFINSWLIASLIRIILMM